MHHGDDPKVIRQFEVNHAVRERWAEVTPGRRIKLAEHPGMSAYLLEQSFHFEEKALAQHRVNRGVIGHRLGEFSVGGGMNDRSHGRSRREARARDSANGMPSTWPLVISATRRLVSAFQAASTP